LGGAELDDHSVTITHFFVVTASAKNFSFAAHLQIDVLSIRL
jgi:hypothetical protein